MSYYAWGSLVATPVAVTCVRCVRIYGLRHSWRCCREADASLPGDQQSKSQRKSLLACALRSGCRARERAGTLTIRSIGEMAIAHWRRGTANLEAGRHLVHWLQATDVTPSCQTRLYETRRA